MPESITRRSQPTARPGTSGTVTVRAGDSLWVLAGRHLGDPLRWTELRDANKAVLDRSKGVLHPGMVLQLGRATAPTPTSPQASRPGATSPRPGQRPPQPASSPRPPAASPVPNGDRFTRSAPLDAQGRWTRATSEKFAKFVPEQVRRLKEAGTEIDCSDFAAKLLSDFSKREGLPNPVDRAGSWHRYDKANPGGLPNVEGPNYFFARVHADNLAKSFTRPVPDQDRDGTAGADRRTGAIDVDDLEPGDMLFYDWDGDGIVNHTVNFVERREDGTVVLAYGSYNNLGRNGGPVTWGNLDLTPIEILDLKPGSEGWERWLGADNSLWGVRRYAFRPSATTEEPAGAVRMSVR